MTSQYWIKPLVALISTLIMCALFMLFLPGDTAPKQAHYTIEFRLDDYSGDLAKQVGSNKKTGLDPALIFVRESNF